MGDIKHDPTILILTKKIKNNNLIIIDNRAGQINAPKIKKNEFNYSDNKYGGEKECIPYGDLFETKKSIIKVTSHPHNFVITDALNMSFGENKFDIIIDRITHEFIFRVHKSIKKLIEEYYRVLKNKGKVIFFSNSKYSILLAEIKNSNFKILKSGRIKKNEKLIIDGQELTFEHDVTKYVVIQK